MSHSTLIADIGNARSSAAAFFVCNLHMHSPASDDYGQKSDLPDTPDEFDPSEKRMDPAAWIAALVARNTGLQVLAITDHNTFSRSCSTASCSSGDLTILPGCEVSVRLPAPMDEVVHVLAIFDQTTSVEEISHVFSLMNCKTPESKRTPGFALECDLGRLVAAIHDASGVCVFAHVGSDSGLRKIVMEISFESMLLRRELDRLSSITNPSPGQVTEKEDIKQRLGDKSNEIQEKYLSYLIKCEVDAIQVAKPGEESHYGLMHTVQVGGDKAIPCILATDGHRLCDACLPKHVTYIKMARPSAAGLKAAFTDPGARIRFFANVPPTPYPRIRGIRIDGTDAFFTRSDQLPLSDIGFSDNLTCIIGGRGSGKSCIIEGLRFALNRVPEFSEKKEREKHARYLSHLFNESSLQVVYDTVDDDVLVINRKHSEKTQGEPTVEDLDGNRRRINVASSPDIPVDIYGQSELECLATDKASQRELIDRLIPDVQSIMSDIRDVKNKFEGNSRDCVSKAKRIQQLNDELIDLEDIKARLASLSDERLEPLIDQEKYARQIDEYGTSMEQTIAKANSQLDMVIKSFENQQTTHTEMVGNPFLQSESKFMNGVKPTLDNIGVLLGRVLVSLQGTKEAISKVQAKMTTLAEKTNNAKDKITEEMRNILSDDDGAVADIIEERNQLEERYAKLRPKEMERETTLKELLDLLRTRRTILMPELEGHMATLFSKRQSQIQAISNGIADLPGKILEVTLDLEYRKDRSEFRELLGEWEGSGGFLYGTEIPPKKYKREWARFISEAYSSFDFVDMLLKRDREALFSILSEEGDPLLSDQDVDKLLEARAPFSGEGDFAVDQNKLDKALKLVDNGIAEDLPGICLSGRPIEGLSPGQRCSALLPVILLSGSWPIVIDQPEDNLDNQHIFECLVEIVRELKHKRQIICATHNANIVVSGDSEQVIVCQSDDKEAGRILRQASIDDTDVLEKPGSPITGIVTYVKEIMEGGERAFKTRAEKYGFRLTQAV